MVHMLAVCYFMAFVAALLKAGRHYMDYRRTGQRFYLIGVPTNFSLAIALALIIVASGADPLWRGPVLIIAIRTAIILWAIFSLLFEILYGRTYLVVQPPVKEEEDDSETHSLDW